MAVKTVCSPDKRQTNASTSHWPSHSLPALDPLGVQAIGRLGDIQDGAGRRLLNRRLLNCRNECKIIVSKSTRGIGRLFLLLCLVLEEKQVQIEGVIVYP